MTLEDNNKIGQDIIRCSVTLPDQAGRERTVIKEKEAFDTAAKHSVSLYEIYETALKNGILPYRYIRNLGSITIDDQLKLLESRVGVVGAGGLGGQAIILLARLGIGNLVIIDHDVFDETNLNRQALSGVNVLGKSKAETAKAAVANINPAVCVTAFHARLENSNADDILKGSDVIIDALDNVADRFTLEDFSKKFDIPLVHGAVAGLDGQIMTIFPGDTGMENIYSKTAHSIPPEKSPVAILGVPAFTPAIVASYQVIEVIKIILKNENPLRNMLVYMDLAKCESRKLRFKDG